MLIVDTHAHVLPPSLAVPPGPGNKPPAAALRTKEEYYGVLAGHGVTHGLLVQPSTYQFDNSAMLAAMAAAPADSVKGIAVMKWDADDAQFDALARRGVVGARLNLISLDPGAFERPEAKTLLTRIAARDWWLQVHVHAADFPRYEPYLRAHPGRVIFDHLGRPDVLRGTRETGFVRLLEFARQPGRALKLSGAIHSSRQGFPYADLRPFVAAAIDAFGLENCVWGSDWPFMTGFERTNYLQTQHWLETCVPDAHDRGRVLWENPARLFGFVA